MPCAEAEQLPLSSTQALQTLAGRINAVLPQTQCTRCGYADCAAYAEALARGDAGINQCPPGGALGVARLAAITGRPMEPLNQAHGVEAARAVAVIDENWCIGCTLCIKACPTDAILGLNKRMHTVIAKHCTGCELCVPACPVDCIRMENVSGQATGWAAWSVRQADQARSRYQTRQERLQREQQQAELTLPVENKTASERRHQAEPVATPQDAKQATVAAALARARARRTGQA